MYWLTCWEVFDQAKQGFCVFNCKFEIIYANNKAKQMLENSNFELHKQLKSVCRHFIAMIKKTNISNYSSTLKHQLSVISFACFSFYSVDQTFIMIVFDAQADQIKSKCKLKEKVVFTLREKEILRAVAAGKTNKEISEMLNIGFETVKSHMRNLFAKTGTGSRTELISKYCNLGNTPENMSG